MVAWIGLGVGLATAAAPSAQGAAAHEEALLRGYALAVVTREFNLNAVALQDVRDGEIRVNAPGLTVEQRDALRQALQNAPGVRLVTVMPASPTSPTSSTSPTRPERTTGSVPASPTRSPTPTQTSGAVANPPAANSSPAIASTVERPSPIDGLLPAERLFDPLMADPRWPHFAAALHHYIDDGELATVGAVSFGETFSLYQKTLDDGSRWGLMLPAGVFAIFDMESDSRDLVNADYRVGVGPAYRTPAGFSAVGLLYHQSSHLGDEFLLRNRIQRINLSYEGVDIKLSQTFDAFGIGDDGGQTQGTREDPLRIYVGGGYLVHTDPDDLDRWSAQGGFEFRGRPTLLSGKARPVAAVDLQWAEENQWDSDVSLRVGLEFANPHTPTRRMQFMLEYYNGHSPNGQFYGRAIQYLGFGIHGYF